MFSIPFACGCHSAQVFHCVCLSPIDSSSSWQGETKSDALIPSSRWIMSMVDCGQYITICMILAMVWIWLMEVGHYIHPSCWYKNGRLHDDWMCQQGGYRCGRPLQVHNNLHIFGYAENSFFLWSTITMVHFDGGIRAKESRTLVLDPVCVWLSLSTSVSLCLFVTH